MNTLAKNITLDFLQGAPIWQIVILAIFLTFVASFIIRAMYINRKIFGIVLAILIVEVLYTLFLIFGKFDKEPHTTIKLITLILFYGVIPLATVTLIAPEIRKHMDGFFLSQTIRKRNSDQAIVSSKNKEIIADTIFDLSSKHIGALITIEKYNSLEQFSERAIHLNADISKELLMNTFIPNTPLHDGAVIIKDDKIVCAGAYFTLTKNLSYEKTTGSRHRAALGVSEISDALTIVASEETGDVSVAYGGVLMPVSDREGLVNYMNTLMK